MTFQHEPGARGNATGLGDCHRRLASDTNLIPHNRVPTQWLNRLRRQRLVEHLHRLGPSPLAHFLREIETGADIYVTLEQCAALPADFIRAYGGDRFAPSL